MNVAYVSVPLSIRQEGKIDANTFLVFDQIRCPDRFLLVHHGTDDRPLSAPFKTYAGVFAMTRFWLYNLAPRQEGR
jgi:hypothetical protein